VAAIWRGLGIGRGGDDKECRAFKEDHFSGATSFRENSEMARKNGRVWNKCVNDARPSLYTVRGRISER
jgi:hypothetical protein